MVDWKMPVWHISHRTKLTSGALALLALGVAGGAAAMSLTRPSIEMAPTVPTAIARLPQTSGVVTVKGKVVEAYGSRFIIQDGSGRTLVDAGPESSGNVSPGNAIMVQGRFENGQVRASYLVDPQGQIADVGPPPPRGPGRDGPSPPAGAGRPDRAPGGAAPPPPPTRALYGADLVPQAPPAEGSASRSGTASPPPPVASPAIPGR